MSHKKYRQEKDCLNCGTEVIGKFCHNCGQENVEVRDNFFAMVWHFITDYFHFDSKFFRSLILLFTKPGFLTKEYWEGRRMRYIPPLRLFFFVTIIFMISTSYFYGKFGSKMKESMIKGDKSLGSYDSAALANIHDTTKVYLPTYKQTVTGKELREMKIRDDRQHRKLQSGLDFTFKNLKYVTFFLLPVYALIFKMLFLRRKSFYIDHLIYVMHLQTFAYVFLTVIFLIPAFFPSTIDWLLRAVLVFVFIYVLFSLRYLYHQQWWKTVLKSAIATFLLIFTTSLTIMLVSLLDAMLIEV
jgi:hypothetical protein